MQVLYFHQYFSTPKGAAGTRSYEMAQALIRDGHSVTMVCATHQLGKSGLDGPFVAGQRRGAVDGIRVIELDLSYSNYDNLLRRALVFMKFSLRSVRLALTEPFDIAFATTTPLTAGIPGIFSRWIRKKPFVFEVRDLWPELPREMGVIKNPLVLASMSGLEWLSYHSADRCVALSPGIAEGIERRGIPSERIAVIPNGCDLNLFHSGDPWRPAAVRDGDLLAIFTGAHGIANGLGAVLDAAAVLRARGRDDIKLLLVGDGKLKPELVERARKEKLDNVVFHDPVGKHRIAGLMAAADVGMQILANVPAFYYGTSPNKFFDYLAAGLPVLNNYPGWLAEIIEGDRCGFAVPPCDPKAFADALEWAADHRDELKQMGRRARAVAARDFDRRTLGSQWVNWVLGAARRNSGKADRAP